MSELEELKLAYAECSRQRNELLNKLKSQAQREWVGLTHQEIRDFAEESYGFFQPLDLTLTLLIEAKLKEKNT